METVQYMGRDSNQEIAFFLYGGKLLRVHTNLAYILMLNIYKFHKNLPFLFPKILEYVVIEHKCNIFV